MRWFVNLRTRSKLFLGFGLMVVFLAVVIQSAYSGIAAMRQSQRTLYEEEFAIAARLAEVRSLLEAVRTQLLTMMSVDNRSEQQSVHENIESLHQQIEQTFQRLLKIGGENTRWLERMREMKSVYDAFSQTRDNKLIPLIYEGSLEEARNVALGIQAERYAKFSTLAEELANQGRERARGGVETAERRASRSVRVFVLMGLLALGLGIGMSVYVNQVISTPLQDISRVAERVATRDLTVGIPSDTRRDEIGTLAMTFHRMLENLKEATRETQEGTNVLGSSASQILSATTQVAAGAAETSTALSETTTTVEEVKQTAQLASQKAKYVSETAQKAVQVAQQGRKAVEETVRGMNRIQGQVGSIADSIVRLSEQSQAIGEIIATVNDLAEQSNLLAVNASIEAAKAGEQGKGFAVVAQEVKNLAEQSKQATAQVRTILGDIQKATSATVMATEQGSKAAEAGVKQSIEAGEAIRLLADSITEAAQAATQIAASSQQQLVGMDQVASAMENIKQASAQNVASTKQAETAAQNLHDLGHKLKQLVGQYKT